MLNSPPSTFDMALRLLAATIAGAMIGMERETHGRPAGLRTTILTCVASALAMLISEALFYESGTVGGNWRPDPARLGAGILTGIGFLGAGTILRHEKIILGVTTAASLWFVTVLGLAFGSGLFKEGAIGLGIALVALLLLPRVEKFIPSDWYATMTITMDLDALTEQELKQRLKALGLKVKRMDLNYDFPARQKIISCELKLEKRKLLDLSTKALAELRQCRGIQQIKWT